MKKSGIFLLLAVTLVFAAFIAGFYLGRNSNFLPVQVQTILTTTQSTQATSLPLSTASTAPVIVNINIASLEQLQTLPGIGPVLAARIIDYRMTYGYFDKPEELGNVEGIGPEKLKDILPLIKV